MRRLSTRSAQSYRFFQALYRCRKCGKSFWATRARTYYIAASFGAVVALAGLVSAITLLGPHVINVRQLSNAAHELEETIKRAQAEDPVAEYDLAHRYATGTAVRVNASESTKWLARAAEHGHTQAQFELGMASLRGEGTLQDFPAALKWLSRAAEGGHAEARYNLGLLYKNGIGVAPDDFKAYIWLNLAVAQGVHAAFGPRETAMRSLSPHQIVEAQAASQRLNRNTVEHAGKSKVGLKGDSPSR